MDLSNLSGLYLTIGRYSEAVDCAEQTLRISSEIGDLSREAAALGNLGLIAQELGLYDLATYFTGQALESARLTRDRRGEALRLNTQAKTDRDLRLLEKALRTAREAITIAHEIGTRNIEADAWLILASISNATGDFVAAAEQAAVGLTISRDIGYTPGESAALAEIENAESRRPNPTQVRTALDLGETLQTLQRLACPAL